MGFLKTLILGDPGDAGMQYRIRVFDHGHHIKTATLKNRGQDLISLVVKPKDYGFLGEEVKLGFMINPAIPPRYFGNIMEIDFDVRDSTQLGDLFDICPDLVYQLNQNFADTLDTLKHPTTDAEYTDKTGSALEALTDPVDDSPEADPPALSPLEKKLLKVPGVPAVTNVLSHLSGIQHNFRVNLEGVQLFADINYADYSKKQELIKKCLAFCEKPGNEKALRWLPKRLHIEPEVTALVSQSELDGVGIMPMYYIKQSSAEIAEKMLMRPKTPADWKEVLIYILGIVAVVCIFGIIVMRLAGKL